MQCRLHNEKEMKEAYLKGVKEGTTRVNNKVMQEALSIVIALLRADYGWEQEQTDELIKKYADVITDMNKELEKTKDGVNNDSTCKKNLQVEQS